MFAQEVLPVDLQPVNFEVISKYQKTDPVLQQLTRSRDGFTTKTTRGGEPLIYFQDKVYVPEVLRHPIVDWYHLYLLHPGET